MVAVQFKGFMKGIGIKMRIRRENFLQDGISLGSAPHFFSLRNDVSAVRAGFRSLSSFIAYSVYKDTAFRWNRQWGNVILWGDDYRQWNKADAVAVITKEGCVRMAHLGRRLQDSASVIDLGQLPSS